MAHEYLNINSTVRLWQDSSRSITSPRKLVGRIKIGTIPKLGEEIQVALC